MANKPNVCLFDERVMPQFVIRIINETFAESAETELPHLDAAQAYAIKAAIDIGAEEVLRGEPMFLAEASVELDGEVLRAMKVSRRSILPSADRGC